MFSCSVGPGALSSYSTVMLFPGLSPTGPRAPTVMVRVNPSPSGDRLFFSRVIPAFISVLICSESISFPFTLMVILETSGASKRPGMSSVIRIKLMSAEPLFVSVKHAPTFWALNERRPDVEYVFSRSASTTWNFFG